MNSDDVCGLIFVMMTRSLIDNIWYPSWLHDFVAMEYWKEFRVIETGFVLNVRSTILTLGQCLFIFNRSYNNITDPLTLASIGLLLFGWILSKWAKETLRHHGVNNIGVVKDQFMIRTGPYVWLVHPQWTGELIASTSIFFIFIDHLWLLVSMTLLNIAIYINNSKAEEALLVQYIPGYYEYLIERFRF